ncbi:MAG: hypothetical protein IIC31_07350 [Chloroflexi bacterium]|nr:hypothetical protein [Chloroflexota bacterium]
MRLRLLRRWAPVALLTVVWAFGWLAAWALFLFDRLAVDAGPEAVVFVGERGDRVTLWVGVGTALVLGTLGFLLLVNSSVFRLYSRAWSRVWLVSGALLLLVGLSAPVVYPSTRALVIDPGRAVVALEQRWLYTQTAEVLPFDEIARVALRVRRTRVGTVATGCQVATGLSIVGVDGSWLDVPSGFDHEAVAAAVSDLADAPLETFGTREC